MKASIAELCELTGELRQYSPRVLRNVFCTASPAAAASASAASSSREPQTPTTSTAVTPHDANQMADAVENFLTELTRALSIGLREGDGVGLWPVLAMLEGVSDRMQEAETGTEATGWAMLPKHSPASNLKAAASHSPASPPLHGGGGRAKPSSCLTSSPPSTDPPAESSASAQPSTRGAEAEGAWWRHRREYFNFAAQLTHAVRSAFPAAPRSLQVRMLLRLALNRNCLLASLELLRRWCRVELKGFYETSSSTPREAINAPSAVPLENIDGALLTQPDTDGGVWGAFAAAIAPVAGPSVSEIGAGAPKTRAQLFDLQLVVAGLDDDTAASLRYYTQVQSYVRGRRPTRPSALVCYEAGRRRYAQGADASTGASTVLSSPVASFAAALVSSAVLQARRGASAVPTQPHGLQVEVPPIARTAGSSQHESKGGQQKDVRREGAGDNNGKGEDMSAAAAAAATSCEGDQGTDDGIQHELGKSSTSSQASSTLALHERCRRPSSCVSSPPRRRSHGEVSAAQPFQMSAKDVTGESPGGVVRASLKSEATTMRASCAFSTEPTARIGRKTDTASGKSVHATKTNGLGDAATQRSPQASDECFDPSNPAAKASPRRQPNAPVVSSVPSSGVSAVYYEEATPGRREASLSGVRGETQHTPVHQKHPKANGFGVAGADVSLNDAPSSLAAELVDLRARVLQCWTAAVAHAELQERKRLSARDGDANNAPVIQ